MIAVRAPLRISFCGGGSDIPSFYEKYGGCVVSASIDKYVYLFLNNLPKSDKNATVLKYLFNTEVVTDVNDIQNSRFKQCLLHENVFGNIEISSMSDIECGTGLGSSSAFTVALLRLLKKYKGEASYKYDIAKDACDIEINKINSGCGKQDQYASAIGGLNFIEFNKDGSVKVNPIHLDDNLERRLINNLMLFYIGGKHDSSEIVKDQTKNIESDKNKEDAVLKMCEIARKLNTRLRHCSTSANLDFVGECLHENWMLKKTLSSKISNDRIDEIYYDALDHGAIGGKLLGAGSAGYMLFYVPENRRNDVFNDLIIKYKNVSYCPFKFEYDGVDDGVYFND